MYLGLSHGVAGALGSGGASAGLMSALVAGDDPDLLLDVDLRLGAPSGWTQYGTPVYDPVLGFIPNGLRAIQYGTFPHNAAMAAAGAIVMEVQRSGIAYDDATRNPGTFADLEGNTDTTTATPSLLWTGNDFSTERWLYVNQNATTQTLVWLDDRDAAGGAIQLTRIADKVPAPIDPDWATVILTWSGTTEYLIIDGLVIEANTTTSATARMGTVTIGGRGNGTPSVMWRNGAIRRVQFVGRSLAPVTSALRIGLIGDSFVVGATTRNSTWEPGVGTEAQIDAVQTDLEFNAARTARINAEFGNGYWGWWLQSLAYQHRRERVWFKMYNAGDAGNGWRGDLGGSHKFGTGAQDALANWDDVGPDVIIAFGSVNDLNLGDTTHTLAADIESYLEALAAKCTSLQRIIWFDTFFTPESYQTNNTAAAYAEAAAQRAAFATLNPTLVNGSAQPVEFVRVETWPLWAPDGTQPLEYAIGSHPNNDRAVTTPDANDTKRTATIDGDVHPTSEGYKRIAEIVWPYLRALNLSAGISVPVTLTTDKVVLTGTQPRDLHVRASTVEVDATNAVFNGTRIALCAADRPNGLTITGGRYTNLMTSEVQGAWCIGPIRDQNLHDYGDVELVGCHFEGNAAQAFHAFGGGTSGYEAMTWGNLTFTNCIAKDMGGEIIYVKGPQTGDITATGCVLGSYDTRTGWASDHTAFAGDGLDFSNAQSATWSSTILIISCEFYNLDGYAIVASSNNVTLLNNVIEHCWDSAAGATNVHSVLHDPYGPTSSFQMSGGSVITAKEDGGLNLQGASGISGTAVISTVEFRVNGDHITTSGRLGLTEVSNDVDIYTGTDPKA
jgi:lysophospholipase L1-like esterase